MFRLAAGLVPLLIALAGCTVAPVSTLPPAAPGVSVDRAARQFSAVVERVAPVAEQICRERVRDRRCDFAIYVDERPGQPSNAYQTEDSIGRPVIVFTLPLIAEAQNADELAFILGHEAAHHIAGHLDLTVANAQVGAMVLGSLAAAYGATPGDVELAASLGAELGARRFSKAFELEADALGARITQRAGYDPVLGSAYFTRIPDPGDEFLGTHPPTADRQEAVRRSIGG